jgi:signal transduction histidine kinase
VNGREVDSAGVGDARSEREALDRLDREVAVLRASRERLVLWADAESRRIERALHAGVQQKLVALSMALQQASALVEHDSALKAHLDEIAQDIQHVSEETAVLAERIDAPMLEVPGRLAVALRAAATAEGVPASVDVAVASELPHEVARTVLLAWFDALEDGDRPMRPAIVVREDARVLAFEVASGASLERLRDRVEALGGKMSVEPMLDGGWRVSGSLPLSD